MRYLKTFVCTFLAVLAVSVAALSLFSVAVSCGTTWTSGNIPTFLVESVKYATLFGFTAVVIHLLVETCCYLSKSFKATISSAGAVTAVAMLLAGILFGLISRLQ